MQSPDASSLDATKPDPGSDIYPAAHPPLPLMINLGGDVIKDPKLITVTFVGNALRDATRAFNEEIIVGDYWAAATRGYGINKGTHSSVELSDTLAGKTLDNEKDLKPWIQQMVDAGSLPAPDENTVYAFYLSPSTSVTIGSDTTCKTLGGFHGSSALKLVDDTVVDAAYAVIGDCGVAIDQTSTHEFLEAVTDPHPNSKINPVAYYMRDDAWAFYKTYGGEVADNCAGRGPFTTADGHEVARSYVNAAAKESKDPCQPELPGEIYFAAAPVTETVTYVDAVDPSNTHESGSYITIKAGETKDVDVTVFSDAKLPHDLTVVVGKPKISDDLSQLDPIAPGVDTKLSASTGRNGQHITLTITAAANASQGDHHFVVRAFLEPTDYHTWFVILRVTK